MGEPRIDEIKPKVVAYLQRVSKAKNRDVARAIEVPKPLVDKAINELAKEDEIEFIYLGTSYVKLKGAVASHKLAKAIVYIPKPVLGEISIDKFKAYASAKSSDVLILDARDAKEASKGMIKHALNIPTQDVINRLGEIPKNKLIVVHCKTGVRAEMAYQTLVEQGYNVKFLKAKIKIKSNGSFKITQS